MKQLFLPLLFFLPLALTSAQGMRQSTYCDPLSIDYTHMIHNSNKNTSYRSGADPAVVRFHGGYYMFVARSDDYQHFKDLLNWDFITPKNWYPQGGGAPATRDYKDSVLYVAGDPSGLISILCSNDPKWGGQKAAPVVLHDLQNPGLFIGNDSQVYMFQGSPNIYPIRRVELDKDHCFPLRGRVKELFSLDMPRHSWEYFDENHSDTVLGGYTEDPQLTKHNGRYYMQYGAPGTKFNVYVDGVYIIDHPTEPYTCQKYNPVPYKLGGYMNDAKHGSMIRGPGGTYWHLASVVLSTNINWERRLCMLLAGLDKDGIMYIDTRSGDYPRYAPAIPGRRGRLRGWILPSYRKLVTTSAVRGGLGPAVLTDELTKTFWFAEVNGERQQMITNLEGLVRVCVMQVDYHDYRSDMYGRVPGLHHRYVIESSTDGETQNMSADRKSGYKDIPSDYMELEAPAAVRYVRYKGIDVPTPSSAISELHVSSPGFDKAPHRLGKLTLGRHAGRRDITIRREPIKDAQGYNVPWSIASGKLYSSWAIYNGTELLVESLATGQDYYFAVEASSKNGISLPPKTRYVE